MDVATARQSARSVPSPAIAIPLAATAPTISPAIQVSPTATTTSGVARRTRIAIGIATSDGLVSSRYAAKTIRTEPQPSARMSGTDATRRAARIRVAMRPSPGPFGGVVDIALDGPATDRTELTS